MSPEWIDFRMAMFGMSIAVIERVRSPTKTAAA